MPFPRWAPPRSRPRCARCGTISGASPVRSPTTDGAAAPFFGRPARTAPALAQFALKYVCPVVPLHVVREDGFRFRIIVEPALDIRPSGDRHPDVAAVTAEVNRVIEGWIRATPG